MTNPSKFYFFLISRFISSWSVTLHKSLLEIMFGHHILKTCLRHRLTKICILRWILLVASHVSHPYRSTDFKQALKILILVSLRIDVDSHTFLSFENDPLAFCMLTWTSVRMDRKVLVITGLGSLNLMINPLAPELFF